MRTAIRCLPAAAGLLAVLCSVSATRAADYTLTIDPAQSNITFTVGALGLSDTDASAVTGALDATLTPASGTFTTVQITRIHANLTDDLTFTLDGGILGGVNVSGVGIGLRLGAGYGFVGPATAVDAFGDFDQVGNLIQQLGVVAYTGYGVVGASIGSGSENLGDQPATAGDLPGNVVDTGAVVVLSFDLDVTQTFDANGVTVTAHVVGTVVATAPTQATTQPGDTNCDGSVNFFDIDPFVLALTGESAYEQAYPTCNYLNADTNCDGSVNFFDIDPFVVCLTSGCACGR